jgi:hypothetical protein
MVRVFTSSFEFNCKSYEALVFIANVKGQFRYHIRLMDPDLHSLIPNGEIRYTGKNGYEDLGWIVDQDSKKLMYKISHAIECKLSGQQRMLDTDHGVV